jgi:uncharacterized protein (TIGR02145 family)
VVQEEAEKITCTDTDSGGNTYKTIQIGNQVWMAKNLAVAKYNDGKTIQHYQAPQINDFATYLQTFPEIYVPL